MANKLILKQLKEDYLDYVFTWVDSKIIQKAKIKFKVKWDADLDRVFFQDEQGRKIPAYFITALLAKIIQKKYPLAKIVHDSRLVWAIQESVKHTYYERERVKRFSSGARGSYICRAGWSNFLNFMHKNKILFGGEASGHYFFNKDNLILNDGFIPVLLIAEYIAKTGKSLSELIRPYREKYFISNEINLKQKIDLKKLARQYQDAKISHLDGLSVEYPKWRFNLRPSQTENLWRLNIESRVKKILAEKKKELYEKI